MIEITAMDILSLIKNRINKDFERNKQINKKSNNLY